MLPALDTLEQYMTHSFGGMNIDQLINMLTAARDSGAKEAAIVVRQPGAHHLCTGIDWVSTEVVEGVAYILPMQTTEAMPNAASDAMDL